MATADKLNKLLETKAAIKQAIIDKGVEVGEDVVFADYANKINNIQVGEYKNPDFYEITTANGTNYSYLFANTSAARIPNVLNWDTSNVTDMDNMFRECNDLTELDLSNWDTSKVTDMGSMFYSCKKLASLDVSSFNTSEVRYMNYMFTFCTNLTELDLSNWDTSKVTTTNSMFYQCNNLTSLDLSNFDTSNVTYMNQMFNGCKNLTTITGELDASKVSDGFSYMSSTYNPFGGCTSLESVYLKNIYANCTMTNASKWSINLGDTKVKDECLIYIINELPDLINDKGLTATDQIVFTLPPTNTLTAEQVQIAIDKGWNVVNTNY